MFSIKPQPNGCPTVGHDGLLICMLSHTIHIADQKETALANARLIASAPEMLEALREIAALDNTEHDELDGVQRVMPKMASIARYYIAKATGADNE